MLVLNRFSGLLEFWETAKAVLNQYRVVRI